MRYWLDTFSTGYIDPKTGQLGITSSESSLIVSILSAGTLFGALFAAPVADLTGRRIALWISLCVFAFGVILQTASVDIPLFVAGRFFAGFGVGMVSMLGMLDLFVGYLIYANIRQCLSINPVSCDSHKFGCVCDLMSARNCAEVD